MSENKWKLVTEYPVKEYRCGARAGDRVRLRREIAIRDHTGIATGEIHRAGGICTVAPVSAEPPVDVWLLQTDGERHTWSDDAAFLEAFEILPREAI